MNKHELYKFFSGKATVEEETEILDWIDVSPENREEFIKERNLYNMILIHSEIKQKPALIRRTIPVWVKEAIKVAAVLAILFGMNWYYSKKEESMLSSFNTITVPSGQRVNLILSDSTKVCINAGSELRYPTVFSKGNRKVELQGEAFFEVSHDPKNPFIVETALCDIKVLGTTFNVEAYPGKKMKTSLLNGKIMLSDKKDVTKKIILVPGQEAYYADGRFSVKSLQNQERLRWREGLLCFQDVLLTELMTEFEKYYDVKIQVSSKKEILNHELSGKLKIGDGIDHALRVLHKSIPFKYSKSTNNDETVIIIIG